MRTPKLKIVPAVTREHARAFAEAWIERSFANGAIGDAFQELGLIRWNYYNAAIQGRILDLESEICGQIAEAVRPAMVEAFRKVAPRVLARERRAQRARKAESKRGHRSR